jgi:hypothetical protein
MTGPDELEGVVRSWLREDEHQDADRVLFSVLELLDTTPQRHASWLARRIFPMRHETLRYGLAAAVFVAAAVLGIRALAPASGTPTPSTTPSATPTPDPSSRAIALNDTDDPQPLAPGRYSGTVGRNIREVRFEITIPEEWTAQHVSAGEVNLRGPHQGYPYVGLFSVVRVYRDPCHPESGFQSLPFDHDYTTAQQIIDRLRRLEGFEATEGDWVTLGGRDAYHFFLSNSINASGWRCTDGALLPLFATWEANLASELEERRHSPATNGGTSLEFWVVATDPYPTVVVADIHPTSLSWRAQERPVIAAVIDSLDFR